VTDAWLGAACELCMRLRLCMYSLLLVSFSSFMDRSLRSATCVFGLADMLGADELGAQHCGSG
jgi:hypothetical protein